VRERAPAPPWRRCGDSGSGDSGTGRTAPTDPASVYLSVLARSAGSTLADVSDAMYERRSLVRWMAMRRTLFLLPRTDVPVVQTAVSTTLAPMLGRRLISQLKRDGTEPPSTATSGDG
jgi:Winged helix DNA-binding domain